MIHHVLTVDDEEDIRKIIRLQLSGTRFDILEAEGAEQAISLLKDKCRSGAAFAFRINRPTILRHNLLDDIEPQAFTLVRSLGGKKGVEYLFLHARWDPRSRIPDIYLYPLTPMVIFDLNDPFFAAGLDAVANDVDQHLLDLFRFC